MVQLIDIRELQMHAMWIQLCAFLNETVLTQSTEKLSFNMNMFIHVGYNVYELKPFS